MPCRIARMTTWPQCPFDPTGGGKMDHHRPHAVLRIVHCAINPRHSKRDRPHWHPLIPAPVVARSTVPGETASFSAFSALHRSPTSGSVPFGLWPADWPTAVWHRRASECPRRSKPLNTHGPTLSRDISFCPVVDRKPARWRSRVSPGGGHGFCTQGGHHGWARAGASLLGRRGLGSGARCRRWFGRRGRGAATGRRWRWPGSWA